MQITNSPSTRIAVIHDHRGIGPRVTARVVDLQLFADRTARQAVERGQPVVVTTTGGSVANKYGYPAETDAVLCVAFPDGRAILWATRIAANKSTLSGAAGAAAPRALGAVWQLFDGRCKIGLDEIRATAIAAAERLFNEAMVAPASAREAA